MEECPRYYGYSPLATQNVRLLNIRPGTGRFGGEGKIEIELTHHELGTTDFDALSYTWGPSTLEEEDEAAQQIFTTVARCYPIFCDDKIILVTKSLRDKLRRLRQLDDPEVKAYMASEMEFQKLKYLWVDGICINQDDSLERGRQVGMMARIYSTATTVVIDLGEADEDVWVGLQLAMKLGELYTKLSKTNEVELYQRQYQSSFLLLEFWHGLDMTVPTAQEWWSWAIFLSRTWFSRTWVAQEALLANPGRALVLCGTFNVRLQALLLSLSVVWMNRWPLAIIALLKETVQLNARYKRYDERVISWLAQNHPYLWIGPHWQDKSNPPFYKLCRMLLYCTTCADPRDKVYGTLGMAAEWTDLDQRLLPIDYTLTTSEIYCRATKYAMTRSKNLDLLTAVQGRRDEGVKYELPSWCPDYNSKLLGPYPLMNHGGSSQSVFAASPRGNIILRDDFGSYKLLFLRGKQCDTIRRCETMEVFGSHDMFRQLLSILEYASGDGFTRKRHPAEALARTMLALGQNLDDFEQNSVPRWAQILSNYWLMTILGFEIESANVDEVFGNPKATIDLLESQKHLRSGKLNFPPRGMHLRRAIELKKVGRTEAITYLFQQEKGMDEVGVKQSIGLQSRLHGVCRGRNVFVTSNGRIGLGHPTVREGDEVWLLAGSIMPAILRPRDNGNFEFLGETYVDGTMYGEAWPHSEDQLVDLTLE